MRGLPASLHEPLVEVHVRGADRRPVVGRDRGVGGVDLGGDQREHGRVGVVGAAHRVALDEAPQPVEVDEVGRLEGGDEHPAVQVVHEQPVVAQQAERLAQRVAGDAEVGAEALLRQAGRRGAGRRR
ncbi:hypothetical protein GCM10025868_24070 [Angustibacter aerolatus]|uniref:Uncharacterized protein n=1 Tax=Angustibacter aerolatus TaxID=1162965 RepID=A0ABQ6JHD8_9ACTN|nr:hypothetical protein GCM10025868_24070 [Angustibacter aerolatus]